MVTISDVDLVSQVLIIPFWEVELLFVIVFSMEAREVIIDFAYGILIEAEATKTPVSMSNLV